MAVVHDYTQAACSSAVYLTRMCCYMMYQYYVQVQIVLDTWYIGFLGRHQNEGRTLPNRAGSTLTLPSALQPQNEYCIEELPNISGVFDFG